MGRIQRAYENNFRALLGRLKTRQIEKGVHWFRRRAKHLREYNGLTELQALDQLCERLRRQVQRRYPDDSAIVPEVGDSPHFLCDSGLGGLARWIRAAGYEAVWFPEIEDDILIERAIQTGSILLTTDSALTERRVLRDRILPSVWLAPAGDPATQLAAVLRQLNLRIRPARCMTCGGELVPVAKEPVAERLPPKTSAWLDEYYLCQRCGKVFWHGTHWRRIRARLSEFSTV